MTSRADAAAEFEGVEDDGPAEGSAAGALLRGGEEQAQFLLGMQTFGLAGRLDAYAAQQPEGRLVDDPDERKAEAVKPSEGPNDPEGGGQGLLDGEPFGGLLAGGDVQEGDGRKADAKGNGVPQLGGGDLEPVHHRLQQGAEDGFADPAQAEAGERNA